MHAFDSDVVIDLRDEVVDGKWAIINCTTDEVVEVCDGTRFTAMDVAQYWCKRSAQDKDMDTTLYTPRPATTTEVMVHQ